nr:hypothetical protein [Tanacetum cinerariifolium]
MIFNEFNRLSRINNDLFTCEIEVPKPTPCVEQRTGNPKHNDPKEYEWKISYEKCKKIYGEAVIFINKILIRLIGVTMEQWSYKLQLKEYLEIKRQRETYTLEVDMEYNPSNLVFTEWLALKFYNHLEMDWNDEASNNSDVHEREEQHKKRCNLFDDTAHNAPICKIKRFEMIKYSFGQKEEYVAIKECSLRFASRLAAFCFKTSCVLLQSSLRFASKSLCFASRHAVFCFKTSCVLSQDSCDLSHGGIAFCLLLKTLSAICLSSFRQELLEYMDVHEMMPPRVRNHHGEDVYIRDLVDFDVTMSSSRGK